MSHPVLWPPEPFFRPIRNTPATCLSRYLAPEEDANVLLLECSDPGNILYTIFSDGSLNENRTFDITCCDVEPAITARNVLLFTLIIDNEDRIQLSMIWDIFYNFFIDDHTFQLLIAQCNKLANLSNDLDTWNTCQYSSALRVCSQFTLFELNRLWNRYAQSATYSVAETENLRDHFIAGMVETRETYWFRDNETNIPDRAVESLHQAPNVIDEALTHFRTTGVTSNNAHDIAVATNLNPIFAIAMRGEGFVAHWEIAPLSGFHLASAFTRILPDSTPLHEPNPTRTDPTIEDIFGLAQSQFMNWCHAFRRFARLTDNASRVVIRFVTGDALAFCYTLRRVASEGSITAHHCVAPWRGSLLILDGGDYQSDAIHRAPDSFNVIDASALFDRLGVDIMVAAVPLLSRMPSSTLYTQMVLSPQETTLDALEDRLCCDVTTFSILFDLVPSAYVSRLTTESPLHSIFTSTPSQHSNHDAKANLHKQIVWKIPSLINGPDDIQKIAFAEPQLVRVLFKVYLAMFPSENVIHPRYSRILYNRGSFALFAMVIERKVSCDWDRAMESLLGLIESDSQLDLNLRFYQELVIQFHLLGLHTVEVLRRHNLTLVECRRNVRFEKWSQSIPPIVCVTLVVPRETISKMERDGICPNSTVYAEVRGPDFLCLFACIQVTFGTVGDDSSSREARIIVDEDPLGLKGTSSMIVVFWVPTWLFCGTADAIKIGMVLDAAPPIAEDANQQYVEQWDSEPRLLYAVPMTDCKNVYFTRQSFSSLKSTWSISQRPPVFGAGQKCIYAEYDATASVAATTNAISSLTGRKRFSNKVLRSFEVIPKQITPLKIMITVGPRVVESLVFPFPVDGTRISQGDLTTARRSGLVEITCPVTASHLAGNTNLNCFPVIHSAGTLNVWNMHRVNLQSLPTLDTIDLGYLHWFQTHVDSMFSAAQLTLKDNPALPRDPVRDVLVNVKESIRNMLVGFTGLRDRRERFSIFGLNFAQGGLDTLIFIVDLKLDLASSTVVTDAYALPLTEDRVKILAKDISDISSSTSRLKIDSEELKTWKHLLPALVERCRDWEHEDHCEYVNAATIPISNEYLQNPICKCGAGRKTGNFSKMQEWKPFASYVTRLAISPLFSAPYIK